MRQSRCYDGDGSLRSERLHIYDSAGKLSQIRHLDGGGVVYRVQNQYLDADGNEVSEAHRQDGALVERTTTKRDQAGRVVWCQLTETDENLEHNSCELTAEYDERGGRHRVLLRQKEGSVTVLEIEIREGRETITAYYGSSEGAPLTQLPLPGHGANSSEDIVVEHDVERDEFGNWTKKKSVISGEPSEEIWREITYY